MNSKGRRTFIKYSLQLGLFLPALPSYATQTLPAENIQLTLPSIVEDGSQVPIVVETSLPNTTQMTLIAQNNPNPILASFYFSARTSPWVKTTIKLAQTTPVLVEVTANNQIFSTQQTVQVIQGACG